MHQVLFIHQRNFANYIKFDLPMKQLYPYWSSICIEEVINLQIEKKFHLQIERISADWRLINRSKNDLQINVWSADPRSILSTDWGTIYRWKNYLHIEEICADRRSAPPADWRIICILKKYSIWRLENYPNIEELWSSVCRLKNKSYSIWTLKSYLQIKELSADLRNICRSKNYFQIEKLWAANSLICR